MKKGIVLWTTIAIIPALIIIAFFIWMFQLQIDDYIKLDSRFQALELSGIINMLQASPVETEHEYKPSVCMEIYPDPNNDELVLVGVRDFVYFSELIKTGVGIETGTMGCGEGGDAVERVANNIIRVRTGG